MKFFLPLTSIALIFFILFSIPIFPSSNHHTASRNIEFKVTGLASQILIDENSDFTSPIVLEKPFIAELEPGDYYWKTNLLSRTGTFTIDSEVIVSMHKKENSIYLIKNEGNTILNFILKNVKDSSITGESILIPGESKNIELNNTYVEAQQSEDYGI